ncbi:MAG TPA: hypothetical protein VFL93_03825 [Longimicrobiaceae bacterium]|jgi:hypothetical protein|nr:hypothetical protein [Longimicrobiaceae bacterium]
MEQSAIRERIIRHVPRHSGRQLDGGERVGIALVALLGLIGVPGTLVTAWYLALS